MSHLAIADISLSALRHNFSIIKNKVGNRRILAMVKADAYGHGLLHVAKALSHTDAFGVATIAAGMHLREAGITQPIRVMTGFDSLAELKQIVEYNLCTVVHNAYQLPILQQLTAKEAVLDVWLKVDTGMHRLGLMPDELAGAAKKIERIKYIKKPLGIMTHYADADNLKTTFTDQQYQLFKTLTHSFAGPKSVGNSAAILQYPNELMDWVRPGIMLYGVSPLAKQTGMDLGLQPVMTLRSKLVAVKNIKAGEYIGYGCTYRATKDMRYGVVGIGYGDGYPRSAKTGTPVLVNNSRCPLIGRVSMDMITVDLTQAPHAKVGDTVVLWGDALPAEEVANCANTIAYELFCKLTQRTLVVEK